MVQAKGAKCLVGVRLAEDVLDGLVHCSRQQCQCLGLKKPGGWELTAVDGVGVLVGNLDAELLYWEPVVSAVTSRCRRSMSLVAVGLSKQAGQTYLLNSHHDFHGV
jgi:hypothetical protein